tara:strand:- start:1298 stop:1519 length:222 start_codon:yes stop_codon:yes gene_type:complete
MFTEFLVITLIGLFLGERYYYYSENGGFCGYFEKNKKKPLLDSSIAEYRPLDIPHMNPTNDNNNLNNNQQQSI